MKIRPYNRKDVARVLEIFNQLQTVPVTLERFLRRDLEAEKRGLLIRRVLETDEGVVAFSEIMKFAGSRKGTWYLGICVDTAFRRKGYGHQLFERTWQELKALQPVYIETVVSDQDPPSRAWAEARGFRLRFHRIASVLSLVDFRPGHFPNDKRIRQGEMEYFPLSLEAEEDRRERAALLYLELCKDVPDLKQAEDLDMEHARDFLSEHRGISEDGIWIASHGDRWIGMTVLRRISPKEYWNAFTGVSREFRGKGIAKTLKRIAANVAFHQGAERVRTFNLSVNEPVLRVNRSLGYVREPGHWIMERDYTECF